MYLKRLSLINFKNITSKSFEFDTNINCFVGDNGIGKTNVLDAIYCLSFCKSYFNPVAVQNIKHEESFFVLEGEYNINNRKEQIICSLKKGQKKLVKKNGKVYEKFSDHIGQIPLVIISPADRDLVTEGSSARRRFIDGVISQQNKTYLQDLIAYNKVISQRNALLKYFAANRTFDTLNLEVYDQQLIEYGTRIYNERQVFLSEFIPIFNQKYNQISNKKEHVTLQYSSQLQEMTFSELLQYTLEKDKVFQHSTGGIHKDDLLFQIENYPIKKFGSQGQQKSYLVALKLAQFQFIKDQSGLIPILLLDDIFDKLDEHRVAQIINLVNHHDFSQIFITDTHTERTESVLKQTNTSYKIFEL